ncbi:MAG TPA: hypothetical protein VJH71_00400 [Candidatus Paceibacterota bacterium]
MKDKILKLSVFLLVIIAVFLTGYLFNQKINPLKQTALLDNSLVSRFNPSEEKTTSPVSLSSLTSDSASFPFIKNSDEVFFYLPKTGEIKSISLKNPSGGSKLISKIEPYANYISWGTDKQLIAGYNFGSVFYDLDSNFSKKYDSNIKRPVLSSGGEFIAYAYTDPTESDGNISIADPRLETQKKILPTRFSDWQISWLSKEVLFLIRPPTLEDTYFSAFTLDIGSGNLQKKVEPTKDLEIVWPTTSKKLAYSNLDKFTQEKKLTLIELSSGETTVDLPPDYSAAKCGWDILDRGIFCIDNGVLGYFQFLKDSRTSEWQQYDIPGLPNTARNVRVSSTGEYIVFQNYQDGRLYALRVPSR